MSGMIPVDQHCGDPQQQSGENQIERVLGFAEVDWSHLQENALSFRVDGFVAQG